MRMGMTAACSHTVTGTMSPYPTVTMVVSAQYSDAMYCSVSVASLSPARMIHVIPPLSTLPTKKNTAPNRWAM